MGPTHTPRVPTYPVRAVLRPRDRKVSWPIPPSRRAAFEDCLASAVSLKVEWDYDAIVITGSLEGAARISVRQELETRVERCMAVADLGTTSDLEPAYMVGK